VQQLSLPGLLWALPVLPLAGALVALILPAADRLTLRMVALVASALTLVVAAMAISLAWPGLVVVDGAPVAVAAFAYLPVLRLLPEAIPALLATSMVLPIALRAGAPRVQEATTAYVVAVLTLQSATVLALLLDDVFFAAATATVGAVPGFALLALFGGPERGTVTWRAAASWLLVDGLALAGLTATTSGFRTGWLPEVIVVLVLGPGLVRLAAGPHGLWALPVLEQTPVAGAASTAAVTGPLGAVLLWRGAVALQAFDPDALRAVLPVLAFVFAGSATVAAALVVGERDLRRIVAHWNGLLGSIAALGILASVVDGTSPGLALALAAVSGVAASGLLAMIEAVERRLETRKVHELAGLAATAPLLAVLLPALLLLLAGTPGPGTAIPLWPLIVALMGSAAPGVGGAGLWCAGAVLLGAVGATSVAGRVVLPSTRKYTLNIRVSFWQGVRLLAPLAALGALSLLCWPLVQLIGAVRP